MKAPLKMYTLKPVVDHDFAVELPKCMYKLKSIHISKKVDGSAEEHVVLPAKNLDIFDQVKQFLKNCEEIPGMAELEAKQNDILEKLAQLKTHISLLKRDLKLNIQTDSTSKETTLTSHSSRTSLNITCSLPENLVINANPNSPPYSLELLQRLLLPQNIGLTVTCHLHSSVVSLPDPAKYLETSLENFRVKVGVPVVNVRLIWKNINSNSEILLCHTPITGEVNLLRYLSRLANTILSYDSDPNSVEVDSLLDQCYLLSLAKTKVDKNQILQSINKCLSKTPWLLGRHQAGIADVAAYSAIRQCLTPNELGAHLAKWYQRCSTLVSS